MDTGMRRLLLILTILSLLGLAALPADAQVRFKRGGITFVQNAKSVTLQVEVADTPASRAQGLMNRRSLPENAGMLFVFESSANWGFWMKNTLIPLSIAFIGEDWRIVDIVDMDVADDPQNGPFPIYESKRPYRYALEVNQGFFKRKGLGVGAVATYRPASP
jgi:uncharacterized membrane protein (UPF0127 family)